MAISTVRNQGGFAGLPPVIQQQYRSDPGFQLAQALQQSGGDTSPIQGGHIEGLARLLKGALGGVTQYATDQKYQDRGKAYADTLAKALSVPGPTMQANGEMVQAAGAQTPEQVLASNPDTAPYAMQMRFSALTDDKKLQQALQLERAKKDLQGPEAPKTVDAYDPETGTKRVFGFNPKTNQYDIPIGGAEQRKPDTMSAERLEQERALAQMRADNRAPRQEPLIAVDDGQGGSILVPQSQAVGRKPAGKNSSSRLPTAALKMQQEELGAIGTAYTIAADIGAIDKQIESGDLKLGLATNLQNRAINFAGASTPESRNFASFKATLEKLRNDTLRLNKGVQTEGDAVRAFNELMDNINDPNVVRQRLGEIKAINERAANLRRMNVDGIRRNYGMEPLDTTGYTNQKPAVGARSNDSDIDALVSKYAPN